MYIPGGRGIAFDTNMLARPTQRHLMTLWCELASVRTAVLPQILLELTTKPTFEPKAVSIGRRPRRVLSPATRRCRSRRIELSPLATIK